MAPSSAPAGSATDAGPALTTAAIALGSNLGDREAHLAFAIARLAALLDDLRVSSFHRTAPEAGSSGPEFLNAAAVGRTALPARLLLDRLLDIERERGRERPYPGAARTLDLDLVLYGDERLSEGGLEVPHPRFRGRAFVLRPLAEVGGGLRDPVSGLTVAELLRALP